MRRALIVVAASIAALCLGAATSIAGGESPEYRFAAIFDTANSIVPGQQVKIAGAVVGRVDRVELAPGPKARIVMRVDGDFGPFRADASCTILPEGIVSENYVACSPGADQAELAAGEDGLPTVPLTQTTIPASLQDVLNAFSVPTDDRIRILLNELGLATAGRGEDINEILRRSNPALQETRRVLEILAGQKRELVRGVVETGRVLRSLGRRDQDLRAFVDRGAALAETSAPHSRALGESVRRLPALLDAVRPGLESLDKAIADGTPVLKNVRQAAPGVDRAVTRTIPHFLAAGTPALEGVSSLSKRGRPAVRRATPVVHSLRVSTGEARPFSSDLNELLLSTRDRGGLEGILRFAYAIATGYSAFDQISHQEILLASILPQCLLDRKAAGCSYKYSAPGHGTIPPDDPGCGPQPDMTWDPPTSCQSKIKIPADPSTGPQMAEGSQEPEGRASSARAPEESRSAPARRGPATGQDQESGDQIALPRAPKSIDEPVRDLLDYLLAP